MPNIASNSSIDTARCISFIAGLFIAGLGFSLLVQAEEFFSSDSSNTAKTTFTIGKVSLNPKKHHSDLMPLASYLAANMKDLGINKGEVLIASDNQQMIQYLREGKVDMVTETPFSAVIFSQQAPVEAIALKWKKGVPRYYSVLFARKDSGINSLPDLLGKVLVFEDPGSTSAYLLPLTTLLKNGYRLAKVNSLSDPVPNDMIGFIFSYSEQQTSNWVHGRAAAAGAISNLDWDKPDHIPLNHKHDYHIIHRSNAIPRAIELIHKQLDDNIKERVKTLLYNAHQDPKADYALKRYQKTKRFEALDEGTLKVLQEIKSLMPYFSP